MVRARDGRGAIAGGRAVPHDPQAVREMLLEQRDLGLQRERDAGERGGVAAIRRHTRQNPAGPLLIHQAACAVDRIDDHRDLRRGAVRQHAASGLAEPFGDEQHRPLACQRLEMADERLFRHAIEREDRVAGVAADDGGERLEVGAGTLAAGDNGVAERGVDLPEPAEESIGVADHQARSR
jgi:hypothetical protein